MNQTFQIFISLISIFNTLYLIFISWQLKLKDDKNKRYKYIVIDNNDKYICQVVTDTTSGIENFLEERGWSFTHKYILIQN